jgi:hypothetical protein
VPHRLPAKRATTAKTKPNGDSLETTTPKPNQTANDMTTVTSRTDRDLRQLGHSESLAKMLGDS